MQDPRPLFPGWSFLLAAALIVGAAGQAQQGPSTPAGTLETVKPGSEVSTEMLAANFQATVYEVQAAADRVSKLDAKDLARQAGTPEALLEALSEIGKSRILYRIDQPVNVYSEQITVGSSEPMVTGTRTTAGGQSINTIRYQNVGVIVRLSARKPASETHRAAPDVRMGVQLAAVAPSETEIAPGVKATATRTVSIEHSEPLEFGQPLVMLSVSSSSPADQITPAVYVIRYLFSPPVRQ